LAELAEWKQAAERQAAETLERFAARAVELVAMQPAEESVAELVELVAMQPVEAFVARPVEPAVEKVVQGAEGRCLAAGSSAFGREQWARRRRRSGWGRLL
jgi:hypothetical protein